MKELLEKTMVGGKLSRGIFVVRTVQVRQEERRKKKVERRSCLTPFFPFFSFFVDRHLGEGEEEAL